mgnify:CR=1 FL=1
MGLGEREKTRASSDRRRPQAVPVNDEGALRASTAEMRGFPSPTNKLRTGRHALAGQAAPGAHLAQLFQHAVGHAQGAVALTQADAGLVGTVIVRAAADAQAAGMIQTNLRAKEVKESEADAEIARQKKMVDLAAQEAEVQQRKLDAEVRKQADAELYRRQKEAEAQKYEAERAAEAAKFAKQQEAEGIELVGKAEAEAIRQKGLAEAEAMKQKAEAYKQYNDAAVAEMMIKVLPEIAKSVAQPLASIDKVSIIGGDASGVSGVSGNVPVLMAQTMEAMKEATGIDMKEIVRANSIQAKTDRNINVTGLENLQTPQASAPTAETTADHATVTE